MEYVQFPREAAVWHILSGRSRYSLATYCGRSGPQEDAMQQRRARIVKERPDDTERWCPRCKSVKQAPAPVLETTLERRLVHQIVRLGLMATTTDNDSKQMRGKWYTLVPSEDILALKLALLDYVTNNPEPPESATEQ